MWYHARRVGGYAITGSATGGCQYPALKRVATEVVSARRPTTGTKILCEARFLVYSSQKLEIDRFAHEIDRNQLHSLNQLDSPAIVNYVISSQLENCTIRNNSVIL
jgi:hypothetical protein